MSTLAQETAKLDSLAKSWMGQYATPLTSPSFAPGAVASNVAAGAVSLGSSALGVPSFQNMVIIVAGAVLLVGSFIVAMSKTDTGKTVKSVAAAAVAK